MIFKSAFKFFLCSTQYNSVGINQFHPSVNHAMQGLPPDYLNRATSGLACLIQFQFPVHLLPNYNSQKKNHVYQLASYTSVVRVLEILFPAICGSKFQKFFL